MSDTTNKTPGQVVREVIQRRLSHSLGREPEPRDVLDKRVQELCDEAASAVLAHAAPKWHPVSEPVQKDGHYFIRFSDGVLRTATLRSGKEFIWYRRNVGVTHWCGPIQPPPFQEKP